MPDKEPLPPRNISEPSTFATRRQDREARREAGEPQPQRRQRGLPVGYGTGNQGVVISHVRA